MQMSHLTAAALKYLNFENPRWLTAAIWKTVNLLYLCNRLIDSDELWRGDVYWQYVADRPLKFQIFENPRCRRPQCGKSQKSHNGLTDVYESWYEDVKRVSSPLRLFKILCVKNPRWRTATIFKTANYSYFCNL